MIQQFNIATLFPASFGGRGIPFPGIPAITPGNYIGDEFDAIDSDTREWPELPEGLTQNSALGTKFYMPIGFKMAGKYYQLPWEPSMTITTRTIIVKTPLAGNTRRGRVKELINEDDFILNIQGLCLDPEKKSYPVNQVEILKNLKAYKGSIEIKSLLADLFEIKNVVIEELQLPAVTGRPYSQPFLMTLSSDEDYILIKN